MICTLLRWIFLVAIASVFVSSTTFSADSIELNGHTFTLQDGFAIELVAGPPLVERPIVADFDEQGRLYVADSSGSNDKVEKQLAEKPHRIVRLEDTDDDGRFDRSTIFADRMMFPEGTMWLDGSLYVAAPPSIWKLTDTDGDGVADERVEWFQGKTLTGCANDLHGPYLGADGWIYWCKGAFAQQTYERPGKPPLVTRASHIFRCRPDGSGIEPVMTGGMDNPVDVVFTRGGERILSNTFLVHPGGGHRDGLLHAVYGGVYGKVHDVLDGHVRTSHDVMPIMTHMGPAAPSGLAYYESMVMTDQETLFAAQFNLRKVSRHSLKKDGATFRTTDEDFVVSENVDFHPTDVLEDADGSLLVVDTGGWYKLCCPTSQLVKPDVLGAIYRVRRKDMPAIDDARGLKLRWSSVNLAELVGRLDDSRPAVQKEAIRRLTRQGAAAVPMLAKAAVEHSSRGQANAVWTLSRINHLSAREAIRQAISDNTHEDVCQAAIHTASLWRDRPAVPNLVEILSTGSPQNVRAAAEALGRIGDKSAVPALLEAIGRPIDATIGRSVPGPAGPEGLQAIGGSSDQVLQHSLIYALIEIADPSGTASGLASDVPTIQRAALIALDQMRDGGLTAETAIPLLAATDTDLSDAAAWVVSGHPEWSDKLAVYYQRRFSEDRLSDDARASLYKQLARVATEPAIQALLAKQLMAETVSAKHRAGALHAMRQSNLKEVPESWVTGLAQILASHDTNLVAQAVSTVRALPISGEGGASLSARLLEIANQEELPSKVRLEALAAVPGGLNEVSSPSFALLVEHIGQQHPLEMRTLAADTLTRATLKEDQLLSLADSLGAVGPLELERLLTAVERSRDERIGLAAVESLLRSPVLATLQVETLKPRLARFGGQVAAQAELLYAKVSAASSDQSGRLEQLLASLMPGDVRRGQAVFNSSKAACAACHAIGYLGGKVGPDLTRIGQIRTERDLLEAIILPSASFVRSYEPVSVLTTDGKVHAGLLRKDSAEEIVLATSATEQVRVPRDTVEEIRPGTVSIMPAGLDQQLTFREIADLLAFLKACK